MSRHDHLLDAFKYAMTVHEWKKWFDSQPWYYRWWRRIVNFFTGKPL